MSQQFPAGALSASLQQGMQKLGITPPAGLVDACLDYLQLLEKWNRAYNLTAVRDYPRMVSYHVLDSLSALPYVQGEECLDVGTGAGLPGIILALAEPRRHWLLLDSNHKKIRFVNQVKLELGLDNVETVCQRTGNLSPDVTFSTIICRAYASLENIVAQTRHLVSADTCLLAMKGHDCASEVHALQSDTLNVQTHAVKVPGISETRSIVEIRALPQ